MTMAEASGVGPGRAPSAPSAPSAPPAPSATSALSAWQHPTVRAWLLPFLVAGVACIVGAGLLAAATAYVTTQKTAWATAYLVLVGGVAQVALGAAVTWLRPDADPRWGAVAFATWNLGNAGVLAGQLAGVVAVTDVGSALLVIALVSVLVTTVGLRTARGSSSDRPAVEHRRPPHPALLWAFRVLIVILVAGIAVGTALAHLGA